MLSLNQNKVTERKKLTFGKINMKTMEIKQELK